MPKVSSYDPSVEHFFNLARALSSLHIYVGYVFAPADGEVAAAPPSLEDSAAAAAVRNIQLEASR